MSDPDHSKERVLADFLSQIERRKHPWQTCDDFDTPVDLLMFTVNWRIGAILQSFATDALPGLQRIQTERARVPVPYLGCVTSILDCFHRAAGLVVYDNPQAAIAVIVGANGYPTYWHNIDIFRLHTVRLHLREQAAVDTVLAANGPICRCDVEQRPGKCVHCICDWCRWLPNGVGQPPMPGAETAASAPECEHWEEEFYDDQQP